MSMQWVINALEERDNPTNWNKQKILDTLRTAVKELNLIKAENRAMRIALASTHPGEGLDRIDVEALRARVAELEATERCDVCNSELSQCGDMCVDGPEMDCLPCRLRARVAELEAEFDQLRSIVGHPGSDALNAAGLPDTLAGRTQYVHREWLRQMHKAGQTCIRLEMSEARVAELEAERGIPARCPECGEPVLLMPRLPHMNKLEYRVECRVHRCDYLTEWYVTPEDAWRAHRDVCDAKKRSNHEQK